MHVPTAHEEKTGTWSGFSTWGAFGMTAVYDLLHAPGWCMMSVEEASLDDKELEWLLGKEGFSMRKHLAKTPAATLGFNEALAGVLELRRLHVEMDTVFAAANGWEDIALQHDFYEVDYLPEHDRVRYTIHPDARREVLKRLLALNHAIPAEEGKAGLWGKKGVTAKKKAQRNADEIQLGLF